MDFIQLFQCSRCHKWQHNDSENNCEENQNFTCKKCLSVDPTGCLQYSDKVTWTSDATSHLIYLVKENYREFCGKKIQKNKFYLQFTDKLQPLLPGVTIRQVEKKWHNILKQLKKYEDNNKSKERKNVRCPEHYDILISFVGQHHIMKQTNFEECGLYSSDNDQSDNDSINGTADMSSSSKLGLSLSTKKRKIKEEGEESRQNNNDNLVWTSDATLHLIYLVKENYTEFYGKKIKKNKFYLEFTEKLQPLLPGVNIKQVEKKWHNILKQLKKYENNNKSPGRRRRLRCPEHYDTLMSFMEERLLNTQPKFKDWGLYPSDDDDQSESDSFNDPADVESPSKDTITSSAKLSLSRKKRKNNVEEEEEEAEVDNILIEEWQTFNSRYKKSLDIKRQQLEIKREQQEISKEFLEVEKQKCSLLDKLINKLF